MLRKWAFLLLLLAFGPLVGLAQSAQDTIPPGTKITMRNWRQYKQFMSDGLIALFEGRYFWKMPADVEIDVGPPIHVTLPSTFKAATEKYSGQVRVVHLPNGHNDIANYIAGEPFPNPQPPDRGYKILADLWYSYNPYLTVGMPGSVMWKVHMIDRFGNVSGAKWAFVYRQLAFNTDPGVPRTDPLAKGAYFTQWLMVEAPQQAKYTTDLNILPRDNQQEEQTYVFIPALRRSLRLSESARCATLLGTDWTHDDQKPGFNGGLAIFDADYLGDVKVLSLVNMTAAPADFPANYDMPLAFAKPSWGKWSLRDAWVINVHRIPSQAAGYCYSKRIIYVDKETMLGLWGEIYDAAGKLWKVTMAGYDPRKVPGTDGETLYGRFYASAWDLQNEHITLGNDAAPNRWVSFDSAVPKSYNNVPRYSLPSGLMQIMK